MFKYLMVGQGFSARISAKKVGYFMEFHWTNRGNSEKLPEFRQNLFILKSQYYISLLE